MAIAAVALLALGCGDSTGPGGAGSDAPVVARVGIEAGAPALLVEAPSDTWPRVLAAPPDSTGPAQSLQEPRWRPDGARLAFVAVAQGVGRLLVATPGGTVDTKVRIAAVPYWGTPVAWSPDGGAIAAAVTALGDRRALTTRVVAADLATGTTRVLHESGSDGGPRVEPTTAVRWATDGRVYVATIVGQTGPDSLPTPVSRVWAIDGGGVRRLVRDSLVGLVQDLAPDASWVLALRRRFVSSVAPFRTADDYRELARIDVRTGAATALASRERLPVPLLTPGDPRVTNDRIRWARLSADGARVVVAINVEQGDPFATRLVYRALTRDGAAVGDLPGDPTEAPGSVALLR
ncbi:hypothetical protein rosag_04960 [Roseisolibacter agri]|uniref:Translocation protein TolB n=1 Tax=Roseisolibacter agri TaxID=2014610 RepID=A0AA37V924_9BACT|nr:hypothetical protein rosag_04960 [Roseisolibacter agri]